MDELPPEPVYIQGTAGGNVIVDADVSSSTRTHLQPSSCRISSVCCVRATTPATPAELLRALLRGAVLVQGYTVQRVVQVPYPQVRSSRLVTHVLQLQLLGMARCVQGPRRLIAPLCGRVLPMTGWHPTTRPDAIRTGVPSAATAYVATTHTPLC